MKRIIGIITSIAIVAAAFPVLAARSNFVTLGDIDSGSVTKAYVEIAERAAPGATITLRINSFGGSVFAGLDFIQAVEDLKLEMGVKIRCIVDTRAMSMGFAIMQSGVCDSRLMTKRSMLLAHNASSQMEGNAVKIESELAFLKALDLALAEICAGRLKISVDEYRGRIQGKDWTFGWREALEVGAIDGTIEPDEIR